MKTAIVTGASSGIGLGIANALLEHGYCVVANARRISDSHTLRVAENLALVDGDIGDRTTAQALTTTAIDRFGSIDLLVNNAGIFISKPFTEYSVADFCAITRTNLAGFFHCTQLALTQMRKQNSGHVITITSSVVDQPIAGVPSGLANLTKGGLQSATRALAIESANQGIRFNAIAPGVVNTPMHPKAAHEFLKHLSPLNRLAEVSEIVAALLYLESASFVNGEILHVDGGAHAGKW
jgi:NAD(P)-dependent dehydrogenase (short-subunit alcohol dehydrogenase family)